MVANIEQDNNDVRSSKQIISFFKKNTKIRYNKKITGKVRLYISEKNSTKSFNDILSLYENSLN